MGAQTAGGRGKLQSQPAQVGPRRSPAEGRCTSGIVGKTGPWVWVMGPSAQKMPPNTVSHHSVLKERMGQRRFDWQKHVGWIEMQYRGVWNRHKETGGREQNWEAFPVI